MSGKQAIACCPGGVVDSRANWRLRMYELFERQ
jgi:hypothetical protein